MTEEQERLAYHELVTAFREFLENSGRSFEDVIEELGGDV